ncbi:MAG: hypothetical protein H6622_09570 [Halobacteriovoraceae bacterium]|nr:hypothetical protein [Halobacteriovoraceae bacterium]
MKAFVVLYSALRLCLILELGDLYAENFFTQSKRLKDIKWQSSEIEQESFLGVQSNTCGFNFSTIPDLEYISSEIGLSVSQIKDCSAFKIDNSNIKKNMERLDMYNKYLKNQFLSDKSQRILAEEFQKLTCNCLSNNSVISIKNSSEISKNLLLESLIDSSLVYIDYIKKLEREIDMLPGEGSGLSCSSDTFLSTLYESSKKRGGSCSNVSREDFKNKVAALVSNSKEALLIEDGFELFKNGYKYNYKKEDIEKAVSQSLYMNQGFVVNEGLSSEEKVNLIFNKFNSDKTGRNENLKKCIDKAKLDLTTINQINSSVINSFTSEIKSLSKSHREELDFWINELSTNLSTEKDTNLNIYATTLDLKVHKIRDILLKSFKDLPDFKQIPQEDKQIGRYYEYFRDSPYVNLIGSTNPYFGTLLENGIGNVFSPYFENAVKGDDPKKLLKQLENIREIYSQLEFINAYTQQKDLNQLRQKKCQHSNVAVEKLCDIFSGKINFRDLPMSAGNDVSRQYTQNEFEADQNKLNSFIQNNRFWCELNIGEDALSKNAPEMIQEIGEEEDLQFIPEQQGPSMISDEVLNFAENRFNSRNSFNNISKPRIKRDYENDEKSKVMCRELLLNLETFVDSSTNFTSDKKKSLIAMLKKGFKEIDSIEGNSLHQKTQSVSGKLSPQESPPRPFSYTPPISKPTPGSVSEIDEIKPIQTPTPSSLGPLATQPITESNQQNTQTPPPLQNDDEIQKRISDLEEKLKASDAQISKLNTELERKKTEGLEKKKIEELEQNLREEREKKKKLKEELASIKNNPENNIKNNSDKNDSQPTQIPTTNINSGKGSGGQQTVSTQNGSDSNSFLGSSSTSTSGPISRTGPENVIKIRQSIDPVVTQDVQNGSFSLRISPDDIRSFQVIKNEKDEYFVSFKDDLDNKKFKKLDEYLTKYIQDSYTGITPDSIIETITKIKKRIIESYNISQGPKDEDVKEVKQPDENTRKFYRVDDLNKAFTPLE